MGSSSRVTRNRYGLPCFPVGRTSIRRAIGAPITLPHRPICKHLSDDCAVRKSTLQLGVTPCLPAEVLA
jgi:hypothetical protein